jgi:uncharacterized low-complexity protein
MNTSKTAVSLAFTAALGSSGVALADDNPFAMQLLGQGYQVAEADAKMPEGKCGGKQMEEGKCGGSKAMEGASVDKPESKAKDGKCGEGKCGASKGKPAEDSKE